MSVRKAPYSAARRQPFSKIFSLVVAVALAQATLAPVKIRLNTRIIASLHCALSHILECNRTAVVFDTNIQKIAGAAARVSKRLIM